MGARKVAGKAAHDRTHMVTKEISCARCKRVILTVRGEVKQKKKSKRFYCEECVQQLLAIAANDYYSFEKAMKVDIQVV